MAASHETLTVSSHLTASFQPFGLDIGASLAKVTYCENSSDTQKGIIHMLTYSHSKIDEALNYLAAKLKKKLSPETKLITTGVNGEYLQDHIQSSLSIRTQNVFENKCLITSLMWLLKNLPLDELLCFPPEEGLRRAMTFINQMPPSLLREFQMEASTESDRLPVGSPSDLKSEDLFPFILVCIGSGCPISKVTADGHEEYVRYLPMAGKTFLALGNLLTGISDFDELVKLAQCGKRDGVDMTCGDVKSDKQDSIYAALPDDIVNFVFGKAAEKPRDNFKKEDLVRAVLCNICENIVQVAYMAARLHNCKNVLFSGTFASLGLVREEVTYAFTMLSSVDGAKGIHTNHFYIKHGSYLPALGSLLGCPSE